MFVHVIILRFHMIIVCIYIYIRIYIYTPECWFDPCLAGQIPISSATSILISCCWHPCLLFKHVRYMLNKSTTCFSHRNTKKTHGWSFPTVVYHISHIYIYVYHIIYIYHISYIIHIYTYIAIHVHSHNVPWRCNENIRGTLANATHLAISLGITSSMAFSRLGALRRW